PDVPLIAKASALTPMAARSLIGLAGRPTIVAVGPLDDRGYAEQLAAAFATVRSRCNAQLVLFGTGAHRHGHTADVRAGCGDQRARGQGSPRRSLAIPDRRRRCRRAEPCNGVD